MRYCNWRAVKDFLALEAVMHRKRGILYTVQYGHRRREEMGGVFMRVDMSKLILVLLSLSIYHFLIYAISLLPIDILVAPYWRASHRPSHERVLLQHN